MLLSGIRLERLVPGPGPSAMLFSVVGARRENRGRPLARLRVELGAVDPCARFYLPLNHFDLGREKALELLIVW